METHKTTAKDFFLHLGLIISLYCGIGFLLNLLFSIIDSVYPTINSYNYYSVSNISFPVAALIIVAPVFLVLASLIAKNETADPSRKEIWIKKWSVYLTMFIAGAIVAGGLISVLYYLLDGRDLTVAFLLKVSSLLLVLGAVFGYFKSNLNNKLTDKSRMIWRVGAIVLVVVSIILGFTVIGSPKEQRYARYDSQRIMDLQNIQSQIINYWQSKGVIPEDIDDLNDSLSYYSQPNDPETSEKYQYRAIDKTSFELCATFSTDMSKEAVQPRSRANIGLNDNWQYKKGLSCFKRTIDPQLYPVYTKDLPLPVR